MKILKRTILPALLLAACLLFSGCIGDLVVALAGPAGSTADESAPAASSRPAASSSSSQASSASLPESAAPASEAPTPEEEAPALIALDPAVMAFMEKTNGEVRAANGDVCAAYIMYGGAPVADYIGRDVAYPFSFWLTDWQDVMMTIWAERSDGMGNAPEENIWADDFTVWMVEAYGDAVQRLFGADEMVTYAQLEEAYGQAPQMDYTAAGMGVNYSYDIDTWSASYTIEGYQMDAVFSKEGEDYAMFSARVYR